MTAFLLPLFFLLTACAPEADDPSLEEVELDQEEALLDQEEALLDQEQQQLLSVHEVLSAQDIPGLDDPSGRRDPIAFQPSFPFTVIGVMGVDAAGCNVLSQRAALNLAQLKDESLARLRCRELGYQNFDQAYFQAPSYFYKSPKCFASAPMVVTSCR
ncbi:MAG TPA: hypothetical protein PKY30_12525 [Myxococcota bacterium]|nr:hypothetical protein [Myxococcota bacterium]